MWLQIPKNATIKSIKKQYSQCDYNCIGMVCEETAQYRMFSRIIDSNDSLVVEIGCSTGKTTEIIERVIRAPNRILAVDTSKDFILKCLEHLSTNIWFEKIDVLADWEHFIELVTILKEKSEIENPNLYVFIDIGGNREFAPVVAMIPRILKTLSPKLILLKNREFYNAIAEHGEDWDKMHEMARTSMIERNLKKKTYPLKMPARVSPEGIVKCRFHNSIYGCKKKEKCEFDHKYCQECNEEGHRGCECPEALEPLLLRLLTIAAGES